MATTDVFDAHVLCMLAFEIQKNLIIHPATQNKKIMDKHKIGGEKVVMLNIFSFFFCQRLFYTRRDRHNINLIFFVFGQILYFLCFFLQTFNISLIFARRLVGLSFFFSGAG